MHILITLCLLLSCILFFTILKIKKLKDESTTLKTNYTTLENKLDNLQLQTLESRLNPHLFKNVLNSIQSHAYQTYYAMDKLSGVLDYILYESQSRYVTPKDEIEFALNLIEINKIKISPLFSVLIKKKIETDSHLYEQKIIAPLISIDFIENAFKHADLQSPDAFITFNIEFRKDCFILLVSNKISEKSAFLKEHSGIGTTTLEQRLKIIYKQNYKLERYTEGDVYIAKLKIDFK